MSNATLRTITTLKVGHAGVLKPIEPVNEIKAGPFAVKGRLARSSVSLTPLLLAACGGGGSSTPAPTQTPTTPTSSTINFSETSSNTFTADDDNDSTLDMSSSTENLTVIGKGGNDKITTGSGDDTINGGGGFDTIDGGPGADVIDGGGSESNLVTYENSSSAVTVNLSTGTGSGGDAEGDTLVNINHVTGSDYDDHLTGTDGYNILRGGDGNDVLNGLGGYDVIYTGAGQNTVDAGTGDDRIIWEQSGPFVDQIDGGDGNDELDVRLVGRESITLDLSQTDISNIEVLGLESGSQNLVLTRADVIAVTDSRNSLTINIYGGEDRVEAQDGGWLPDSITLSGFGYYQMYFNYTNAGVTLSVESHAELVGLPAIETNFTESSPDYFVGTVGVNSILYRPDSTSDLTVDSFNGNDSIITGAGDDIIKTLGGDDTIHAGAGANYVDAGDGDDQIVVTEGSTILGGTGNDFIYGGYLEVGVQDNDIDGGSGDDQIYGDQGSDIIYGGTGNDALRGQEGNDILRGEEGNDFLDGGSGDDHLLGGDGRDRLYGADGSDILEGGADNDELQGVRGADVLEGGLGNDTFYMREAYGDSEDSFDGGDGYDTLNLWLEEGTTVIDLSEYNIQNMELIYTSVYGDNGDEAEISFSLQDVLDCTDLNNELHIEGEQKITSSTSGWVATDVVSHEVFYTSGSYPDDFYAFTNGSATVYLGIDLIRTGEFLAEPDFIEGPDNTYTAINDSDALMSRFFVDEDLTVYGKGGDDRITTGNGNDTVEGGIGDDRIYGGNGNDALDGGEGSDVLSGDQGDDILRGGAGADSLYGEEGADYLDGGEGYDFTGYWQSDEGVIINLTTGEGHGGHAEGDTLVNMESITGSDYDDQLIGDDEDNNLDGYHGSDILRGEGGNDILQGGAAGEGLVDTLYGGSGDDQMQLAPEDIYDGGDGTDTIKFMGYDYELDGIDLSLTDMDILNIEVFDLSGLGSNTLTFTAQDILDVTDDDNILILEGNGEDTLISTGEGWVQGADQGSYHTYTSGDATLLVHEELTFMI